MKKKSLLVTVAAASTFLIASPFSNKAEAENFEQTKQIQVYQQSNLTQESLQALIKKYNINISEEDINKVVFEVKNSIKQGNLHELIKVDHSKTTNETISEQNNALENQNTQENTPTNHLPSTPTSNSTKDTVTSESPISAFEQEVVDLTNKERAKYGLSALQMDTELSKVAKAKSQDMSTNNYFDHTSPTYGSPFDMMKSFGISYKSAGENIAKGQATPEEVVTAWMNSEGHRANILSNNYTHIGVGYVEIGNYWTQQFIGK